jgi:hypothetical protein
MKAKKVVRDEHGESRQGKASPRALGVTYLRR